MTLKVRGKSHLQKTFYKAVDIRRVLVGLGISGVLDGIAWHINHDPVAF